MKKILFYIYSLNKGGAERVLVTLCEQLKKSYEVVLLTDCYAPKEYSQPDGIRRIVLSESEGEHKSPLSRLKQIRGACKTEKPDIVIAFMVSSALRAILANLCSTTRVIAAVRSNPYDDFGSIKKKLYINFVFSFAKAIVCQTEYQKDFFSSFLQRKCYVILNPITSDFIDSTVSTDTDNGSVLDNRIVSVGRLYDYKNHSLLIRAFANIKKEFPHMTLTIYGDGPYREATEQLIQQLKVEDSVSLPGDVDDVAKHIKTAALFVLPSDTEGMPNALMEAMALKLPCIATDCPCGGPRTLILDGENGFLCGVNQVDELTDKMRLVLSNKELAQKIGNNAGNIVEKCSIENISTKWRECIEKVCR